MFNLITPMVKSLVIKKITMLLSKHFKGINENTLELALMSGTCTMNNLELRTENLQKYFNYKINSVSIGSITLKYSLLSLFYKPIEVFINDFKVSIDKNIKFNKDDFIFEKLKFLEKQTEIITESSTMSGLLFQFYEKAIIRIKNIEICFNSNEQNNNNEEAMQFKMTVDAINTLTVDETWHENIDYEGSNLYYKTFEIKKFTIEQNATSVVTPINLKCRVLVRKNNFTEDLPDINVDFKIPEINGVVDVNFFAKVVNWINTYKFQKTMKNIIKNHLHLFDIYNTEELSNMDKFSAITKKLTQNLKPFDSEEVRIEKSKLYYELYQKFTVNKINELELQELNKYEEKEDVRFILNIRRKVLQDKKLVPKRRFYFWTQHVTQDEKKKICENLQIEESNESVDSLQVSIFIEKLEIKVVTETQIVNIILNDICLKHNSINNRSNCILRSFGVFYNDDFIMKSYDNENFALIFYEKNKLDFSFNNLDLKKLYVIRRVFMDFLKYKIETFSDNSNIELLKTMPEEFRFKVETNTMRYFTDINSKNIIVNPFEIKGNIKKIELDFKGIALRENSKDSLIIDSFNASFLSVIKNKQIEFQVHLQEIKVSENIVMLNIDDMRSELSHYSIENDIKNPDYKIDYMFKLFLEKLTLTYFNIELNNLEIYTQNNTYVMNIKKIIYNFTKILNFNIEFGKIIKLKHIEIIANLSKLDIKKVKADFNFINKVVVKTVKNMKSISSSDKGTYEGVELHQISVVIIDNADVYNIILGRIVNFHIYKVQIIANKTQVVIEHVLVTKTILDVDGVVIQKHPCTIRTLEQILTRLNVFEILPLSINDEPICIDLNIKNICVHNHNITNYPYFLIKSDFIKMSIAEIFYCKGLAQLITDNDANVLQISFEFTNTNPVKHGNSNIKGSINTEFTKTIIFTIFELIDIIVMFIDHIFLPINTKSIIKWASELNFDLRNSLDEEHLLTLVGIVNVLSEGGFQYKTENFDLDTELYNYQQGGKIHLLSHDAIFNIIKNEALNYNRINIQIEDFFGYDTDNNVAFVISNFKAEIIKNMFSMYLIFEISKIFVHTKVYKILLLKHFFLPLNLSYGLPSINSECAVKGSLNEVVYKNIIVRNISINGNQIKFNFCSFIERAFYLDEYENALKNRKPGMEFTYSEHNQEKNIIQTPAKVLLMILNNTNTTRYNIELNDLFIKNGDVYYELVEYFNLILSDLERVNSMVEYRTSIINLFFMESRTIKILMQQRFLVCVEYIRSVNCINSQSKFEGCIIGHIENVSNHLLENYFLSYEYFDKVMNIKGHETMRAKINKDFLFEQSKKNIIFNNYSNLQSLVYFDETMIDEKQKISINQFFNSKFTVLLDNKTMHFKIKTETYEFKYKEGTYLIDISVRDDRIVLRIFNNIIFKNYTDSDLEIIIGNQNVTQKNHEATIDIKAFGDKSYFHVKKENLFFKLSINGFSENYDIVKVTDGIYNCDIDIFELKLKNRTSFVFFENQNLRIICADIVVVGRNGFIIIYVFFYIPYFINNCTGIDLSFLIHNNTYGYTKEIKIGSSTKYTTDESDIKQFHDILPDNTAFIPYLNVTDTVKLTFNNKLNKLNNIHLGINGNKEKEIVLHDNHKYGIMFVKKKRIVHGFTYEPNINEVIIYPFYIINNNLNTIIHLEHTEIQLGKNYINLQKKKSSLIFSKDYKSKSEINFDAIELFSIIKLYKKTDDPNITKPFTEKSVFYKLKKVQKSKDVKNKIPFINYYIIDGSGLYKNIAIEMSYGLGKYANTHILNLSFANIVKNSTKYSFLLSVGVEIIILLPGETREIHFGYKDFFHIFFVDEFGFEPIELSSEYNYNYKYFLFKEKMYRIMSNHDNYLEDFGRYIIIKGLSPKYFILKREKSILFKLITFINGKQRNIEIVIEKEWPIKVNNNTNEIINIYQDGSKRKYNILQNNFINYCYDLLYKEKYLIIEYNKHKIKYDTNDEIKVKHGLMISSYRLNEVIVIDIGYSSTVKPEIPVITAFKINFIIPVFSISISDKREIACIHIRNFEISIRKVLIRNQERLIYDISGSSIQIDDQSIETNFPIVLNAKLKELNMLNNQENSSNKFFRIYLEMTEKKYKCLKGIESRLMDYFRWHIICFSFSVQEFYLRIDESLLNTIYSFFIKCEKHKFIYQCSFCESIVCKCYNKVRIPCKYILIDSFLINPIVFSISFRKGDVESGIYKKVLILLAKNISDFKVKLDAEFLTNIDNPIHSIREVIGNHYKTQFYAGMFKVLLSVDFLGNIGSFTDTFSMGIKDLFYEPFLGLKDEDPKKFSMGLLRGGRSLVKHTVSGLSGVFSKISDSISKNLGIVTFDKEFQNYNKNQYSGYFDDIALHVNDPEIRKNAALKPIIKGYDRFVDSITSGVSGIVDKPFEGAKKGMVGFVKGVGKGAIGLIAKPTIGLFDMIGGMADGIKSGMDGGKLCRIQYPRYNLEKEFDFQENMSYYIYMKYITRSAPKFIYGEFRENNHIILTQGIIFVFSKHVSLEIDIDEISLVSDRYFVYKSKEISASSEFMRIFKLTIQRMDNM